MSGARATSGGPAGAGGRAGGGPATRGAVRRINEPVPADVWLGDDGRPTRVSWRGRAEQVECVLDTWYVDDAWWSDRPLRRIYHEVQLVTGVRLVLSWDLVAQRWLAQR